MSVFSAGAIKGTVELGLSGWTSSVAKVISDTTNIKAHLASISQATAKASQGWSSLGAGIRQSGIQIAAVAASAGTALYKVTKSFLDAGIAVQSYRMVLEATLHSTQAANGLFDDMVTYASKVPHTFNDIMNATTIFSTSMKGGADEVRAWMPLFGDLAAFAKVMGVSVEESSQQFQRAYSSGMQMADQWQRRGVDTLMGFQKGIAYTGKQTREMMVKAWEAADSPFRGFAEKMARTWDGQVSMMQDKWFLFRDEINKAGVFDAEMNALSKLNNAISENWGEITGWIQTHKELVRELAYGTAGVLAFTAAVSGLSLVMPGLTTLVGLSAKAFWLFGYQVPVVAGTVFASLMSMDLGFKTTALSAESAAAKVAEASAVQARAAIVKARIAEVAAKAEAKATAEFALIAKTSAEQASREYAGTAAAAKIMATQQKAALAEVAAAEKASVAATIGAEKARTKATIASEAARVEAIVAAEKAAEAARMMRTPETIVTDWQSEAIPAAITPVVVGTGATKEIAAANAAAEAAAMAKTRVEIAKTEAAAMALASTETATALVGVKAARDGALAAEKYAAQEAAACALKATAAVTAAETIAASAATEALAAGKAAEAATAAAASTRFAALGMVASWAMAFAPIAIGVAAIAAIAASVYVLRAEWNQNLYGIQQTAGEVLGWITKAWDVMATGAIGVFAEIAATVKGTAEQMWGYMKGFFNFVLNGNIGMARAIKTLWDSNGTNFSGALGAFKNAFSEDPIGEWAANTKETVGATIDFVGMSLKEHAKETKEYFGEIGAAVKDQWTQDMSNFDVMGLYTKIKNKFNAANPSTGSLGKPIAPPTNTGPDEVDKKADAAAKKLEALREKAKSLRDQIMPSLNITDDLAKLEELASKVPEVMTSSVMAAAPRKLIKDLMGGLKDEAKYGLRTTAEQVIDSLDVSAEMKAKFRAALADLRKQSAQELYDSMIPGHDVVEKFRDNVEDMINTIKTHPDASSMFSKEYWNSFADLTGEQLQKTLARMKEIAVEAEKNHPGTVRMFDDLVVGMHNANMEAKALAADMRGLDLLKGIDPAAARNAIKTDRFKNLKPADAQQFGAGFIAQQFADLNRLHDLANAPRWQTTVLGGQFWQQISGLSQHAIWEEIAALHAEGGEAEKVAAKVAGIAKAEALHKIASDISGVGGQLSGLASEIARVAGANNSLAKTFQAVAQAAKVASDGINIAAEVASGNWMGAVMNGIQMATDALGLFGSKTAEVKTGMSKVMDEIGKKWSDWADKLTDTLVEFVKTGKLNFKDLADSIMSDILKITIRWAIIQPIMDAVGIHTTASAKGNVFSGGNIVPFARGGIVTQPVLFPMKNGAGLMGEAGPEAVMPLRRTTDGRLGVAASGGGTNIQIIDQRTAPTSAPIETQRLSDGTILVMVKDAVETLAANGGIDRAMGLNYGAKRRPVAR